MRTLLFALFFMLPVGPACADIYRYVDAEGHVHLTDVRRGPGYVRIIVSKPRHRPQNLNPGRREDFEHVVNLAASRFGINQELLHAVILHESAYDARAVSKAGAMGLMQLMPDTAASLGVHNPWDPAQNIAGGARMLRDLLGRYRNVRLALAAYNAGEGSVERYGKQVPPFDETRNYVRKVISSFRENLAKLDREPVVPASKAPG